LCIDKQQRTALRREPLEFGELTEIFVDDCARKFRDCHLSEAKKSQFVAADQTKTTIRDVSLSST